MIYLYVTPSGSVNLIEGDKMPVRPERDRNLGQATEYYFKISWEKYKANLEAAKASSVPVDDQERGKEIIYTSGLPEMDDHLNPQPDTFYGPFDIEYEIRYKTSDGIHIKSKMYLKSGGQPPKDLKEGIPYAILTPSKSGELKLTPEQVKEREEAINWYRGEPVGKLEEKEEDIAFKIEEAMERERQTAEHLHPTGFYLGLEHALELITGIKRHDPFEPRTNIADDNANFTYGK